jgi:hypothetical protein
MGELGRTVEKILLDQTKERNHKGSTSLQSLLYRVEIGLLKNTLRTKLKVITKEQHITQSLLLGGNWVDC